MIWLRQSTASQEVLLGPFLDSTDGSTAETGLTIANTDIKLWLSGATSEASKNSGGATHIAAGRYYAVLDATDTATIGPMEINVAVSGALPVRRACTVLHANVFDVLFGSVAPSTHTAAAVQSLVAAGAVASVTGNVGGVSGVTFPATVASPTNITAGTITTVTNLTNLPTIPANWLTAAGLATDAVTEIQSGLATASALAVVDSIVDDILADTAVIGALGAGLTAIPWNTAWDAEVQSECTDALNAYDPPTNAEMVARTLATADYATASALATVDDFLDTEVAAIKVIADKLDTALELDGAVYRYTTNALEQGPSGGGGVADWTADERTAIRSILGIPGSGTTPADPSVGILDTIRDAIGVVDGVADAILLDTAEIGTAGAGLTALPWNASWDAEVQSECTDALNAYDPPTNAEMEARTVLAADYAAASALSTLAGYVDTEVTAIKLKTDNLPADPADASDVAASFATVNATLATLSAYVDTEVAAIKGVTDKLNTALELDGSVYRYTANALEQGPAGGGGGGGLSLAELQAELDTRAYSTFDPETDDVNATLGPYADAYLHGEVSVNTATNEWTYYDPGTSTVRMVFAPRGGQATRGRVITKY